MKKLLQSLIIFFSLTASNSSFAEYNSLKLGQGAGGFLIINHLYERLDKSVCSYAINRSYSYDDALDEVFLYLNTSDKQEFKDFLDSRKFKNDLVENSLIINEFLLNGKKDGLDEKTLCGMLISLASVSYENAQNQWDYAKEHYSK
tara:strand:+ start:111 stop:548 length:438 start_codon:yes stop_codon:yes gene_type:complete